MHSREPSKLLRSPVQNARPVRGARMIEWIKVSIYCGTTYVHTRLSADCIERSFWSLSGTLTESCPLTFAHPLSLRRPRRRLGCRARHVNHASSSHPSKQPLPAAAFAMSVCRQSVSDSWL